MLILTPHTQFASGNHRRCYIHPDYPDRCIKIPLSPEDESGKDSLSPRSLRTHTQSGSKENVREYRFLSAAWGRVEGYNSPPIPRVYGYIDTDLGLGLEMELIRDYDKSISIPARTNKFESIDWSELEEAMESLLNFCLQYRVLVRDASMGNIVFQRLSPTQRRFVFIDGFGHSSFIPIEKWFKRAAYRYILNKHSKLLKRLKNSYEEMRLHASGGAIEKIRLK